ncbi:hypothetical protein EBR77_04260, partial [bacterium]|nr:hypothetical protein [bacterium]
EVITKSLHDYFVRRAEQGRGLSVAVAAAPTSVSEASRLHAPRHHKKRYNSIAGKKRFDREGRHERKLEALRYERGEADGSRGQTPFDAQAEHDGSSGAGGGVPLSTRSIGSLSIAKPLTEQEDSRDYDAEDEDSVDSRDVAELCLADKRRRGHDGQAHRDQANGGAVAQMAPAATLRRNNGEDEE